MKRKKGISPLIATVLLIAFVVVLAALLFDFGERFFRDTVKDTEERATRKVTCTSTGIEFLEIANQKEVCYNGTHIKFTVINNDITEIEQLKLIVAGNVSTLNVNLNNSYINSSEVSDPFIYPYDNATYGTIRAITIIPGIRLEGAGTVIFCTGRDITEDTVRSC
ncbi:hypothetical protein DRJ17_04850 [Candidatus Woesearchaeota archaeon]|nr:MAG: hypothetical protein DRJ17_04850 [Candidatus Woesearchaeota archaeon]